MIKMKEINLLNAKLNPLTMLETVREIDRRIENNCFTQHCVINAAKVVAMTNNTELSEAVNNSDIVNADGMSIVWAGRVLGYDIPERVAGIDLFYELLKLSEQKKYPVFFLGAKQHVLDDLLRKLSVELPNLIVGGAHHGYFWDDEESVVREISDSKSKLIFVAITSPKKEEFIDKWKDKLGVSFAMGVGGSFDVLSGHVSRAPLWMQRAGLEWFHRFIKEPRRMWKRYLVTNSKFMYLVCKAKLRQFSS
jgi:N-acetylglucosaminyldiphosphoundecaprenol N-acetyl-beta-D-mannosaminyltransferase